MKPTDADSPFHAALQKLSEADQHNIATDLVVYGKAMIEVDYFGVPRRLCPMEVLIADAVATGEKLK